MSVCAASLISITKTDVSIENTLKRCTSILKAKSNFTLFIFEYIYTRSDFKQMEHCH